ncbi:MAG TPA: hypothetical protein VNS32_08450, partial [Flavisolibacter sp.]|nr:hypothetical protein [Flavisolibacter sp.]
MKKFFLLAVLFSSCSFLFAQHKARVSFNEAWKFKIDSTQSYSSEDVNDASWRTLNLPHDWSVDGRFDKNAPAGTGGGALPGGLGSYRKTFTVPTSQKEKTVFIEFDGVYRNSEVFINGHSLGIRPYGYSSFQYDLTPYLKYGAEKNVIAVKVDNSKQPNSRWYSGSGIYRNVWLTTLNKTHVAHWGTYITTPSINSRQAAVRIETSVVDASNTKPVLESIIYDEAGIKIASSSSNISSDAVVQTITISQPKLWSLERPYLYKAVSQLKSGNTILDTYTTNFGIRAFYFDREKGFFLNGKPVKILGVCDHHDLGAF